MEAVDRLSLNPAVVCVLGVLRSTGLRIPDMECQCTATANGPVTLAEGTEDNSLLCYLERLQRATCFNLRPLQPLVKLRKTFQYVNAFPLAIAFHSFI